MKNFIQDGDVMPVAAPYQVASGDGVLVGSLFGVAVYNAAPNQPCELATRGVFDLPKKAGDTPAPYGKMYWDDSARVLTTSPAGNVWVGLATKAGLGSEATTPLRLNGFAQ